MTKTAMASRSALAALAAASIGIAGCESMSDRQKHTAVGAGVGAAGGAVVGKATGGNAATGAVVGGAIGAVAGNLWSKRMEDKRAEMNRATQGTGIQVARTSDNQLRVNVPSDFSFDSGSAMIKPQMRPVLDQFAQGLSANQRITIVGHTDNVGGDVVEQPPVARPRRPACASTCARTASIRAASWSMAAAKASRSQATTPRRAVQRTGASRFS